MTKQVTFLGTEYTVPDFVAWVAQDADGTIKGYQYEPFERYRDIGGRINSYYITYGQEHIISRPKLIAHKAFVGYSNKSKDKT